MADIEVKFKRKSKLEIDSTPVEDGSILFSTDTPEIFMDDGNERKSYSGEDYSQLSNKPQINGVELSGNKTSDDLGISAEVTQVDHGISDTTFTLPPNVLHKWGEVDSLTITLGAETERIVNDFMFSFVSGDTATQLTLPDTVKGVPAIEPNGIYQCSIVDNCFAYGRWDIDVTV